MVEELSFPEVALLRHSCDETRIIGARCEQPGLKELTQLFFVSFNRVHRCQSQPQILHITAEMWPFCLGLSELPYP